MSWGAAYEHRCWYHVAFQMLQQSTCGTIGMAKVDLVEGPETEPFVQQNDWWHPGGCVLRSKETQLQPRKETGGTVIARYHDKRNNFGTVSWDANCSRYLARATRAIPYKQTSDKHICPCWTSEVHALLNQILWYFGSLYRLFNYHGTIGNYRTCQCYNSYIRTLCLENSSLIRQREHIIKHLCTKGVWHTKSSRDFLAQL